MGAGTGFVGRLETKNQKSYEIWKIVTPPGIEWKLKDNFELVIRYERFHTQSSHLHRAGKGTRASSKMDARARLVHGTDRRRRYREEHAARKIR